MRFSQYVTKQKINHIFKNIVKEHYLISKNAVCLTGKKFIKVCILIIFFCIYTKYIPMPDEYRER